jgi:hypothetical protein
MSTPWEIADSAQRMLREAEQARQQASAMMALAERRREEMTGIALWCSVGEHAFGSQDRKRATFTIDSFDEETGAPIKEQHLMCGPCAAKRRGLFQQAPKPAAIPSGVDKQEYTEFLEWKNGLRAEPPATGSAE